MARQSDVLLIFDCCCTAQLVGQYRHQNTVKRSKQFEFLGATGAGGLTQVPGRGSFTSALIWALIHLAGQDEPFTTSRLYNTLISAPDFPSDHQTPILTERGGHSPQRLILQPVLPGVTQTGTNISRDDQEISKEPRWTFILEFFLPDLPVSSHVRQLAESLKAHIRTTGFEVQQVLWRGLYHEGNGPFDTQRLSPLVRELAYHWMRIGKRKSLSKGAQVPWAPILGRRPTVHFDSEDLGAKESARSSRRKSRSISMASSLPSPPTTPSDSSVNLASEAPSQSHVGDPQVSAYHESATRSAEAESETLDVSAERLELGNNEPQALGPPNIVKIRAYNESLSIRRQYIQSNSAIRLLSQTIHGLTMPQLPSLQSHFMEGLSDELCEAVNAFGRRQEFLRGSFGTTLINFYNSLLISYRNIKTLTEGQTDHLLSFLTVKASRPQVAELATFPAMCIETFLIKIASLLEDEDTAPVEGNQKLGTDGLLIPKTVSATQEFLRASGLKFKLLPSFVDDAPKLESTLQIIAQYVDLITVSSTEGHTGVIWKSIQDMVMDPINLPLVPRSTDKVSDDFVVSSYRFKCLDDFTGRRPVWILHPRSVTVSNDLYLSTSLGDLASVWGPAWVVYEPMEQRTLISEIRIRCGTIVPSRFEGNEYPEPVGTERPAHWSPNALSSSELGPETGEIEGESDQVLAESRVEDISGTSNQSLSNAGLVFGLNDMLLIGALPTYSPKLRSLRCQCTRDDIKRRLREQSMLHYLGTSKPSRVVDARQIGLVGGQYMTMGMQMTFRTDPGWPLKHAYLDFWQNEVEQRHPAEFENFWGLLVSACTFNACRVRLVDLLNTDSMLNYMRPHTWTNEQCKAEFLASISSKTPAALSGVWNAHSEWRNELGEVLYSCLRALSRTGYDERTEELSVFWLPAEERTPRRVTLAAEEHRWVNVLKEAQDSMTMAVLTEECLGTKRSHSRRCGDTAQRTILETAICINDTLKPATALVDAPARVECENARRHPWREPDRKWDRVWRARHVSPGTPFWLSSGARVVTVKALTETHLLLKWDWAKREVIRAAVGLPWNSERKCHWEQIEDESELDRRNRATVRAVRPLPVHIC